MNFRVFDSMDSVISAAASGLVAEAEKKGRMVIALSGGTTPKTLYSLLGEGALRERLAKRKVVWVTGDERCVPPDDPQSNSRMINESLFRHGVSPGHTFLRFRTELSEPPAIAQRFVAEWNEMGLKGLDLTILGMGEDGHTASIFPGTTAVDVTDRIATEVWVPRLSMWRVTLTIPVLREAAVKWVLAGGAGKREMLGKIRDGERFPIALVTEEGPESWWFVDKAANPGGSA